MKFGSDIESNSVKVYRKAKSRIHEYAWIIFGWYPQNVWEEEFVKGRMYKAYNDCSPGELKQMFNRAIIVARYPYFDKQDDTVLVGNIVSDEGSLVLLGLQQ